MRYFLLLIFSLVSTVLVAQTYTVVIDGRLPPGTSFPTPSWGDGTTRVQGGSLFYEFRNWDRGGNPNNNVQFFEEISNNTFTELTLSTSYFPAVPGCTDTSPNSVTLQANELIPTPIGGGGGVNNCSAFFSVDAIPEMTITGTTGTQCSGRTIDLANNENFPDEAYTWNFRIFNPAGNPVAGGGRIPSSFTSINPTGPGGSASFNMIDLLGTDVANNIGNTVSFYLGDQGFVFSNSVSIVIDDCTPLLDELFPENASCSDSSDGFLEVALLSGLDPVDNEKLLLTVNTVTPEGFVIPEYNIDIFSLNSTSNGINTFSLTNLVPGTYVIDYQSEIDPDGDGNYEPNGLGIPFTFEILTPSEVEIENVFVVQNPNCPSDFGERRIEVSGGQDFRSGTYHFTKDGGTTWDIPANSNAVEYIYNDLLPGGDYTFGVKLVFSATEECISASSVNQSIPNIPNPITFDPGTGISQQPSNAAATDGSISARVTNTSGTPNFVFELYSTSDPMNPISATSAQAGRAHEFTMLGIGSYFVKIRDGNGCEIDNESSPFELTAAALPSLGTVSTTSPTCNGGNDGSASVTVTYPTATTISYELRDGTTVVQSGDIPNITAGTIDIVSPIAVGNYVLYVISDTGNFGNSATVVTADVIIAETPEVTIGSFTPNDVSCFGQTDGSIDVSLSGGSTYQYALVLLPEPGDWIPLTGNTIENLSAGFYYLTVRNENGCQSATIDNTNILIREPNEIVITEDLLQHQNVSTNNFSDGVLEVNVIGGTPSYSYQWTRSDTSNSAMVAFNPPPPNSTNTLLVDIPQGFYQLTVTDANTCVAISEQIEITEPGPLSIQFPLISTDSCNGLETGTLTATVQGTGNITFEFLSNPGAAETIAYTITTPDRTVTAPDLAAGTYGLRITEEDSGNVTTTPVDDYVIITELEPITAIITTTDATCVLPNSGIIEISGVTGGSPFTTGPNTLTGYEYRINDAFNTFQPEADFNGLAARDYIVTVRDALGCEYNETVTISAGELPILNDLTTIVTNATSDTNLDGSIVLEFEGDDTNYTYEWTGPNVTNPNAKNQDLLGDGNYQVTVTAPGNCILIEDFTVGIQDAFSIQTFDGTPTCFNQATGSLTATIAATGPVTFSWFNQNDPLNPIVTPITTDLRTLSTEGLLAGTYYLEIENAGGQTAQSAPFEILNLPEVSAIVTPTPTCLDAETGTILFSAQTGSPSNSYLYSIDDGATFQPEPLFENLAPGNYTPRMSIAENNDCDFIAPGVTIAPSPGLFWDPGNTVITRASGPNAEDGAITAGFIGGTAPYTFEWAPNPTGANGATITGLGAGVYNLTITDAADCSISENFEVTEVGPLTISNIVPADATCRGEANGGITTTVTGEGTIDFQWTLANGDPVSVSNGVNEQNLTGILAGSYILTATDDNTTATSPVVTIGEPATTLTITNITPTDVSCFGGNDGTLVIQADGGTAPYTYAVNGGAFQSSPVFNNLIANGYTVRVRDANNCEFLEPTPILIIEPQELNLIINEQRPVTAANATNGAIFITVEGGSDNYTYEWTGPNGYTATDEDIINLAAGDYNLTVTDANFGATSAPGCRLITAQPITITEPGELLATATQTEFLACFGDDFAEIVATVQGGVPPYTYAWFQVENGNNTLLDEDTAIIADLAVGTYFVRATDANLVTDDSNLIVVNAPTLLQVVIDDTTNVLCAGQPTGTINITASGGTTPYQYFWSNGATIADITGLDAGVYTIDVEDANGCLAAATATITAPDDAIQIAEATVTNTSAYQTIDGSISLDVQGGSPQYTFVWTRLSDNSNVGTTATINNLAADSYTVMVSDTNGCAVTETYEVTQPDIIEETILPPSCTDEIDGSISVLVNQGNGTFTYAWSTGSTENTITDLPAGSYTLTVTGLADGPLTRTYILENPVPLEVDLGLDRVLCADQTLVLDATVDDASATYSWTSDSGFTSTNPVVELSQTGNYTVTVQSQTGCTTAGSIFVDISTEEIDAEFAMSSQVFVGETAMAVDISYPLPDGIEWIVPIGAEIITQDQDAAEFSFAEAGEYEITIITTRGNCIAQKTKKIIVIPTDGLIQEDEARTGQKLIEDFLVYPNPTSGRFTADVNLTEPGDISIKVFNFANNAMMASERGRGSNTYKIPFDISGMPSGVYAVLLETPYGKSLRKIIIR